MKRGTIIRFLTPPRMDWRDGILIRIVDTLRGNWFDVRESGTKIKLRVRPCRVVTA